MSEGSFNRFPKPTPQPEKPADAGISQIESTLAGLERMEGSKTVDEAPSLEVFDFSVPKPLSEEQSDSLREEIARIEALREHGEA